MALIHPVLSYCNAKLLVVQHCTTSHLLHCFQITGIIDMRLSESDLEISS